MGKWTDKSYITHSEWSHLFGGSQATASSQSSGRVASFRRLPFNHCALTLTPFKTPVCTKEGIIFDKESIMKYIKDLQDRQLPLKNPVTNSALALTDLIPLHFESTGVHDEYRCPITKKIFNSNSHIVAIKNSGNVYLYEAIQKLCFETRNYFDLLNPDISFNKALVENGGHIIMIQDPSKLHAINMNTSELIRDPSRNVAVKAPPGPASSGIMKRVMSDLRQKECQIDEKSRRLGLTSQDATYIYHNKIVDHPSANLRVSGPAVIAGDDKNQQKLSVLYNSRTTISSQMSEGRVAASFTCSSFSPVTKNQLHKESELVQQIRKIKENAYISIKTSLGLLNFELFTRHAPRTVCNFIQLAKTGAYDNTIFHRNIPGFMIQGGDPTGTGSGGKSIYPENYFPDEIQSSDILSHDKRGILSMANHGPNTNSSQFFITYEACKRLDGLHTIFGRLVGGLAVLSALEKQPTYKNSSKASSETHDDSFQDKPIDEIKILSTNIVEDPFVNLKINAKK